MDVYGDWDDTPKAMKDVSGYFWLPVPPKGHWRYVNKIQPERDYEFGSIYECIDGTVILNQERDLRNNMIIK